MTGAGSGDLVIDIEDSFTTAPSTPDPHRLGRNPTVDSSQLLNNTEELSQDGEIENQETQPQRFRGELTLSSYVSGSTYPTIMDFVFDGAGVFSGPKPTSARIYEGVDYATGVAQKEWVGCIPQSYKLLWDGDRLRQTLSVLAADVNYDTSITPSDVTGPALDSTVPRHGMSLDIDSTTVSRLQSAELSIENIAQLIYGPPRIAIDTSMQKPTTSLSMAAILGDNTPSRIEAALGGTGATTPQDDVQPRSATITLDSASSTVATWTLPQITPDTYSWSDVVGEANAMEEIDYPVTGGVEVSTP